MRRYMIGAFAVATCAVALRASGAVGSEPVRSAAVQPEPAAPAPMAAPTELVVVYVGAEGLHTSANLRAAVRAMPTLLRARADSAGQRFFSVGASLGPGVAAAEADLATVGSFDEVSLGGNMRNSVAAKYAVQVVPQVVVLERPSGIISFDPGAERVLARITGVHGITDWVRAGAPIPAARRQ